MIREDNHGGIINGSSRLVPSAKQESQLIFALTFSRMQGHKVATMAPAGVLSILDNVSEFRGKCAFKFGGEFQ